MTRTFSTHTPAALAAVALASILTASPAVAQSNSQINSMMNNNAAQGIHDSNEIESFRINTPKGRAMHDRWRQDQSGGTSSPRSTRIPSMIGFFVPNAAM